MVNVDNGTATDYENLIHYVQKTIRNLALDYNGKITYGEHRKRNSKFFKELCLCLVLWVGMINMMAL